MSIKPYLALVAGLPIILAAIRHRSLRPLFTPEACAAAAVVIGYGAMVVIVFPAYLFTYAPMVTATYLPMRKGLAGLLPLPIVVITASIAFLRQVAPQGFKMGGDASPWLAAAIGGAASFVLQGRGWTYTAYALCMFAIAAPLLHVRTRTLPVSVRIGGFAGVVLIGFCLSCRSGRFRPWSGVSRHLQSTRGCSRLRITLLWGIRSSVKLMGLGWAVRVCSCWRPAQCCSRTARSQLKQSKQDWTASYISSGGSC